MLPEAGQIRLRHMLDALREACGYAQGKSRSELDENKMVFRALVNCIEIIGEAASHVSEETKSLSPSIPWWQITGIRNHLVPVYFDINRDIVWGTISEDLPQLELGLIAMLTATNNYQS